MKRVPLVNSDKFALVDDADFEFVSIDQWRATKQHNSRIVYAVSTSQTNVSMHVLMLGKTPGLVSDHIDFDGLNNQRSNLRQITQQQNTFHQRLRKDNRSGFRGVFLNEHGKWVAFINNNGKTLYLGQFPTPEKAALARDDAAMELRGEWAELNFPERKAA